MMHVVIHIQDWEWDKGAYKRIKAVSEPSDDVLFINRFVIIYKPVRLLYRFSYLSWLYLS